MFSLLLALNLVATPTPSQESIDYAMIAYNIQQSYWCNPPTYDPKLQDRGQYTRLQGRHRGYVTIGDAAFSSWGMLASTLAHELEVHCNQSAVLYRIGVMMGKDMQTLYELEAYNYEIENRLRFKLTDEEVNDIIATAQFFYGDQ